MWPDQRGDIEQVQSENKCIEGAAESVVAAADFDDFIDCVA